jgi:hypothetical protein
MPQGIVRGSATDRASLWKNPSTDPNGALIGAENDAEFDGIAVIVPSGIFLGVRT